MEYGDLICVCETLGKIDGAGDGSRFAIVEAVSSVMRENADLRAENERLRERVGEGEAGSRRA